MATVSQPKRERPSGWQTHEVFNQVPPLEGIDVYSSNLKPVPLLVVASLWYLVLTTVASIGQYFLERRFARGRVGDRQDDVGSPWERVRRAVGARPRW